MKKAKGKKVNHRGWVVVDVHGCAYVTHDGGFVFDKRYDAVEAMQEADSKGDRIARVGVREVAPKRKARP